MAFLGIDLIVLRVRSLAAAEAFYTERFGVPVGPGVLPTSRTLFLAGGPHLDLAEWAPGAAPPERADRVEVRMVVDDLDATFAGFAERGVEVVHPPTALPGGAREMLAVDLDGYRWRFTEPQRPRGR